MYYKNNVYSLTEQGIDDKIVLKFLKTAHNAVFDGIRESDKKFKKDAGLFEYRGLKAIYMTSSHSSRILIMQVERGICDLRFV